MKYISFAALADKAAELNQAGQKWHFHMIGPACIFSRRKNEYEIIIEIELTGEEFACSFSEKPMPETRQMAELCYGPGFLNNKENPDDTITADQKADKNEAFGKIMDRARACCAAGTAWHNHHLFPECIFNPQRGKHSIVFEDENNGEALYAYYDHDPVKDLAELEALFFANR
ncbi:MAG: hypothetical protein QNJ26_01270 [Desulfobacterales bacterium]|nr:hypothetical protein [Desulfobacterales bacterium]